APERAPARAVRKTAAHSGRHSVDHPVHTPAQCPVLDPSFRTGRRRWRWLSRWWWWWRLRRRWRRFGRIRRMQSRLRRKQRQTGGTPILHRLAKQEVSQMVAEKQIDEFVSRMKQAAGQNLQSIVLYGSAATGEYQTEFSNLNLLCVLRESSFSKLSAIAPVVDWWHRQKHPAPLVMTHDE